MALTGLRASLRDPLKAVEPLKYLLFKVLVHKMVQNIDPIKAVKPLNF
jgi:hypothetical protein